MKTSVIAAILLGVLLFGAVLGEISTVRATDELLGAIDDGESAAKIRDVFEKKHRLLSVMISHESLREVEVALSEYEFEDSSENKSRLRESVEHLKRLLFIGYFVKHS